MHTYVQARGVGRAGDGTQEAGRVCTHASTGAILEPGPWGLLESPPRPSQKPRQRPLRSHTGGAS